jgi:dihydrofolate reductase
MRKLILSINTSIDGIISDELSWMQPDTDKVWDSLFDMLSSVDLLVLGGGMWEDYRNYWQQALNKTGFNENEIKYAQYAYNTSHLIFSKKLQDSGWENAQIISGDLSEIIGNLKLKSGKNIQIVGGGTFVTSLISSGLVDEYRLMVNPIILGRGQSLYYNLPNEHALTLIRVETMDNGVVILTYLRSVSKI